MRPNYRRVDAAASRAAPGDTAAPPQGQLAGFRRPSAAWKLNVTPTAPPRPSMIPTGSSNPRICPSFEHSRYRPLCFTNLVALAAKTGVTRRGGLHTRYLRGSPFRSGGHEQGACPARALLQLGWRRPADRPCQRYRVAVKLICKFARGLPGFSVSRGISARPALPEGVSESEATKSWPTTPTLNR